jgi:hypothetical protein
MHQLFHADEVRPVAEVPRAGERTQAGRAQAGAGADIPPPLGSLRSRTLRRRGAQANPGPHRPEGGGR